jgi:GNAT superfamily N-acetyltransferase
MNADDTLAPAAHHTLRPAELRDVPVLVALIAELAAYEQLSHLVETTEAALALHLFGERPVAESWVAEVGGQVVGFALFFTNFSTFRCLPGLYLEDLYVQPAHRGTGLGKALLRQVGRLAAERGCGRFEWSVLDWNAPAIAFYQKMGAAVKPDWRICRVSGDGLRSFLPDAGAAGAD